MSHSRKLLPLRACGCLAANTLVNMGDGCKKQIQDVRIGEMLVNKQGEQVLVTNVFSGCEKMLSCLTLANEITLKATDDHPVLTENGLKAIKDLTCEDIVQTLEQGGQAVTSILTEEYNDQVYTLELLSEDHLIICNGILVGDFFLETQMQESCKSNNILGKIVSKRLMSQMKP